MGGNIGTPVLNLKINKNVILVIEASSFQLFHSKFIHPDYSILLNITTDHLDWHASMKEYIESKLKIFNLQGRNNFALKNKKFNNDFKKKKYLSKLIPIKLSLYKQIKVTTAKQAQPAIGQKAYRGFSTVNPGNNSFQQYDIAVIKQNLLNHFNIRQGEKLSDPNFGCIIWDLLMDPADSNVEKLAKEDIQRILKKDPRVGEKEVKVLVLDNSISAEVIIDVIPFGSVETLYLTYTQQINEGIS